MKITILDGFTLNPGDLSWESIEKFGELTIYDRTDDAEIVERSSTADILVTNKALLNAESIAGLPNLKFIAVTATGVNIVDLNAARQRDIPVSNVPEYGTDTVAQHVMALLLSALHQPARHDQAIRNGFWQECGDFSFSLAPMRELVDLNFGIVGFGRIGRRVGELASAFGMNVLAFSPTLKGKPRPQYDRFDWCTLEQVFIESDVVSLHCPLTDENFQFVNRQLIDKMKSTAILINTARGALIHEKDLADALNRERIAYACLDVVSAEPITDDNPLLTAKNCLLTPHNAWASLAARRRLLETTADNIEAFTNGHPIHVVN